MEKQIKIKGITILMALMVFIFVSCEKDDVTSDEQITQTENVEISKDGWVDITVGGVPMTAKKIGDEYIVDGDIIVIPDHLNNSGKSTGKTINKWPNGSVYYVIDSNLNSKHRVTDAINHWEYNTGITFKPRTNQSNYVRFIQSDVCQSSVGMVGGEQRIKLSDGCTTGNTIHEIGHALGLWHEQSRKDRDAYVTIHTANIEDGMEHNFKTYVDQGLNGDEYTSYFDFNSIMMYGPYFFSKNGKATITKKDGSTYNYQRNSLSAGDKEGIDKMYATDPNTFYSLRGNNGKYVSSENGKNDIKCNRSAVGSWEKFRIYSLGGNKVAIKGNNGRFLSSENGKKAMTCNRTVVGSWEIFTYEKTSSNQFALKGNNGRYVSSENGSKAMTCNRSSIGSWEKFVYTKL